MAAVGVVHRGGQLPHLRLPRPPTASPGSTAAAAAANLPSSRRPVCKFWLQGRCNRRPCRFLHSRPTAAHQQPTQEQPPLKVMRREQQPPGRSSPRSHVWRNPNAVPTSAPCPESRGTKSTVVVDPEFSAPPTRAPPPGVDGGHGGIIRRGENAVDNPAEFLPPATPTPPPPGRDDGGGEKGGIIMRDGDAIDCLPPVPPRQDDDRGGKKVRISTTPDAVEYPECLPLLTTFPPAQDDNDDGGDKKSTADITTIRVREDEGAADLAEGEELGGLPSFSFVTSLGGHQQPITGIVLPSGSHTLFSGSADGTVRVWDCDSGRCVQVIELGGPISCIFAEGHWVFAGGRRGVQGCNTLSGAGLALPGPAGQVCSLATSKDTVFAGMGDGSILAWKATAALDDAGDSGLCFRPAASLSGHTAAVAAVVVGNGCTRLYSGSADGTVRAWDLATLRCLYTVSAHDDVVTSLLCWKAFLLSCSLDGTIKAWAAPSKEDQEGLEVVYTRCEDQGVLLFDGTYYAAKGYPVLMCSLADKSVCLYDLPYFSERGRIACTGEVTAMHSGPHGFFFTGDATGELSVWRWAQ